MSGIPISVGLRCGGCGWVATPPKDQIYLLHVDQIEVPCPVCGASDWSSVELEEVV